MYGARRRDVQQQVDWEPVKDGDAEHHRIALVKAKIEFSWEMDVARTVSKRVRHHYKSAAIFQPSLIFLTKSAYFPAQFAYISFEICVISSKFA